MAQKRMFSKKITEADAFIDMPISSQLLYFHLAMNADDDGFVGSPKRIIRMIGANSDDLKVLISKRFIIFFETGICVVKHWWIHNTLQNDRYKETVYVDEKKQLTTKDNKVYTECLQNVNISLTELNLTKLNLTKEKISCSVKPNYAEPILYLNEKTGKNFSVKSASTLNMIKARFNEGRNMDDFKKVIDRKCAKWKNDEKMMDYLRPKTLFNATNFESYLNENGENYGKPSYIR